MGFSFIAAGSLLTTEASSASPELSGEGTLLFSHNNFLPQTKAGGFVKVFRSALGESPAPDPDQSRFLPGLPPAGKLLPESRDASGNSVDMSVDFSFLLPDSDQSDSMPTDPENGGADLFVAAFVEPVSSWSGGSLNEMPDNAALDDGLPGARLVAEESREEDSQLLLPSAFSARKAGMQHMPRPVMDNTVGSGRPASPVAQRAVVETLAFSVSPETRETSGAAVLGDPGDSSKVDRLLSGVPPREDPARLAGSEKTVLRSEYTSSPVASDKLQIISPASGAGAETSAHRIQSSSHEGGRLRHVQEAGQTVGDGIHRLPEASESTGNAVSAPPLSRLNVLPSATLPPAMADAAKAMASGAEEKPRGRITTAQGDDMFLRNTFGASQSGKERMLESLFQIKAAAPVRENAMDASVASLVGDDRPGPMLAGGNGQYSLGSGSATGMASGIPAQRQAEIHVPLGHMAWEQSLARQVLQAGQGQLRQLHIKLKPSHLGSLDIRLQLDGDSANIAFSSQHALVREAVEASLPRLREQFSASGMNLGQVEVGSEDASRGQSRDGQGDDTPSRSFFSATGEEEQSGGGISGLPSEPDGNQLLDYYV